MINKYYACYRSKGFPVVGSSTAGENKHWAACKPLGFAVSKSRQYDLATVRYDRLATSMNKASTLGLQVVYTWYLVWGLKYINMTYFSPFRAPGLRSQLVSGSKAELRPQMLTALCTLSARNFF